MLVCIYLSELTFSRQKINNRELNGSLLFLLCMLPENNNTNHLYFLLKYQYNKDVVKNNDYQILEGRSQVFIKAGQKSVNRIREAVAGLTAVPPVGVIKAMQGYADGRKRLRLGSWRIIFKFTEENELEILLVIDIGNRGDIYK